MNAKHAVKAAFLVALLATLASAAATADENGEVRRRLAGYRLSALDGTQTTLGSYHGEVVVVNFWASWCAPCRKELPEMNRWNEAWSSRGGRVVAISIDKDVRKARRFVSDEKLTLTVLHDGPDGLAREIDIPSLPCTFLLDRDGRVVTVVRSSSPEALASLQKEAEKLLSRPAAAGVQSAGMGGMEGGLEE